MLRDSRIFTFLLSLNRCLFALYHYFMDCEKKCLEKEVDPCTVDVPTDADTADIDTILRKDGMDTADADGDLND